MFRRSTAWVAVVALLAGGGVAVTAGLASAAPGPNPQTEMTFTKVFDGTGHGTSSASFVNTPNGFSPGDNTASDGVVSSGDVVGYELALRFLPGAARQVSVKFAGTSHLSVSAGSLAQLCQSVPGASASVVSGACVFSVSAGVSASVTRTVIATAADSAGVVQAGQKITAQLGLQGQQLYTSVEGGAVSVVSAPLADLIIRPSSSSYLWNGDGTGSFIVGPTQLRKPGFSPSKGATASTAWQTRVNVSAFPAGTVWKVGTYTLPVTDGWIQGAISGTQTLTFALPGGKWPELAEGDSKTYEVQLDVAKTAFATPDYLNNGDGSQPGGGKPKTFATLDAATGATAGAVFPNNDFSAVTVYRPVPTPGAQFGKQVEYPRDDSVSKFEPGNRFWANAVQTGVSNPGWPAELAPGAQFRQQLSVYTNELQAQGQPAQSPEIVVSDEWDPTLQRVDGLVNVTGPDGKPVDGSKYRLFWSTTATGTPVADTAVTAGWVEQEQAPQDARALRVIFAPGALPVATDPGAGKYTVSLPSRIREGVAPGVGVLAQDTLRGRVGAGSVVSAPGVVRLVFPETPTLQLTHTVSPVSVYPGGATTYTVTPKIEKPVIVGAGFAPQVTVTLDRCVTAPVNQTPGWVMTVTDAIAGPTGRVCGDPQSKPATLTFTPAQAPMFAQSWNATTRIATLPEIKYTAQATRTARNAVSNAAAFAVTGEQPAGSAMPVPAVADALAAVLAQSSSLAQVTAEPVKVQPGDALSWTVDLASSGASETVVALPSPGDAARYGALVPTWSGGGSHFGGTRTLTTASLVTEQTTEGATLFYTTQANPTLVPSESTWVPVAAATPAQLAAATALKVVLSAADAGANARLTVTAATSGNTAGDAYLLWAGGVHPAGGGAASAAPWPGKIDTVLGTVTGTIWNDLDSSGAKNGTEPGYAGVTVGLFKAPNGVAEQNPVQTATTAAGGSYTFPGVRSGDYVVKITGRGANLPASTTSYYGKTATVDPTYSYKGQRLTKAQLASTPFPVSLGGTVSSVDFGFADTHPKVDIDKSAGQVMCNDTTGICDVAWQVTITNLGDTDITAGTLTDTASDGVYDMEAIYGQIGEPVKDVVDRAAQGGYALTVAGRVYSWGHGGNGANGNGGTANNLTAQLVQGLPVGVTQVIVRGSIGGYALAGDGRVYSWGQGANGANGNGGTGDNLTAQLVQGLPAGVTQVIAHGLGGGYALAGDGRVYSWGQGANGANGNGGTGDNLTAQLVQGLPAGVTQVTARSYLGGFALAGDGRVYSWGYGTYGANGNGGTGDNLTAQLVQGLPAGVTQVIARGNYGGCALAGDGRVYSWGIGDLGANGNNVFGHNLTAQLVKGLPAGVSQVIARDYFGGYALAGDERVYAWGYGGTGSNGNGGTGVNMTAQMVQGLPAGVSQVIARGTYGGFALAGDGRVYSWGTGSNGSNGNGGTGDNLTAQVVQGLPAGITQVIARHSAGGFALAGDGRVYSWGIGSNGSNGNGGTGDNVTAQSVQGLPAGGTQVIARSYQGGYAWASDGRVYSWGNGSSGVNGNGGYSSNVTAQPVQGAFARTLADAVPPKSITPVADGAARFVERQYGIDRIPAGGKVEVVVRGKTNQGAAARNVLNQAWFTSPSTPFAGIAKNQAAGRAKPILPKDPGASPDPQGIPGNASCDTKANGQNATTPDSCDQVPVKIPVAKVAPGTVAGVAYLPKQMIRVGGVLFQLFNAQGTKIGEVVTEEGMSYGIPNVPPGNGYRVVASIAGVAPSQAVVDAVFGPGKNPSVYSFGFAPFSPALAGCPMIANPDPVGCFDPLTGAAAPITVESGKFRTHVDAALVLGSSPIAARKFGEMGDPVVLPPDAAGQTQVEVVRMEFKNSGTSPIRNLALSDVTLAGPAITDLICWEHGGAGVTPNESPMRYLADGSEYMLRPGWPLECGWWLPPLDASNPLHRDRATLSGQVTDSGMLVSASDDFEASLGKRAWELSKTATVERGGKAVPVADGATVRPGEQVTYTLTATNTGDMSLSGLVVQDNASQVLNSAKLTGNLPAGVTRAGSQLSWQVPNVAPGLSQQVSYTVTVNNDAYGVPLVNSVTGDGVVKPTGCGGAQPACKVSLATPQWFAFPLPVLGGATVQGILTWGGLIVAAGLLAAVFWRRRRVPQTAGSSVPEARFELQFL